MDDSEAKDERSAEYPFTPWQKMLEEGVLKLSGRPRHCAVNALRGLKRAWSIAPLDQEMAYFRAITAEEEAATALMIALKQQSYPGADKLNHRDHTHKAGLVPFLKTIETMFAEMGFPTPSGHLQVGGDKPRLDIHFPTEKMGLEPGYHATPDEPLNGLILGGKAGEPGSVLSFEEELQKYAETKGASNILEALRAEANLRNRLLYAADNGIAVVENVDPALIAHGRSVTVLLTLTIAILQTREHQLLAVQCLDAYLKALGRMPASPFDYEAALGTPAKVAVKVDIVKGQPPRPTITVSE